MPRITAPSSQAGSSAIETLMVGALVFLLAAAVVGVTLVISLGSRPGSGDGASSLTTEPSAASVPVLEIACGQTEASLDGGAIDAWADGVSVRVAGDVGSVLTFASPGLESYRLQLFEASGSYRLPLAPGRWAVGCAASGATTAATAVGAFDVLDPQHVYVSAQPECPASGCCEAIVDLPAGFTEDERGTLHTALAGSGVRPTDTIERAAYPGSSFSAQPPSPLVYRVVRDLQVVARLEVAGQGDTWSAYVDGCPAG
jgi:hypothetical protein